MNRVILHSDMNSFYASVECLYHPEYAGKPVAVGGDVENRHGIILAKNQEAKKYDVKTAEALWEARAKCPDLIIVPPNFKLYQRFSKMARNIYYQYTDRVEPFGLDEAWLDVTSNVGDITSGYQIAQEIRQRIKSELGLTVSIGVSWNKIFAKFGSDYKKPDAVTLIGPKNYQGIVYGQDVGDLLYVGRATRKKLRGIGILTIGQLAMTPVDVLRERLGKMGEVLSIFARGLDASEVKVFDPEANDNDLVVKSIGNSMTTPRDLTTYDDVKLVTYLLSESVGMRLREAGYLSSVIGISVRDKELKSFTRQRKIKRPSDLTREIAEAALDVFRTNYNMDKDMAIRSMGVRAMSLVPTTTPIQVDLFTDENKRIKLRSLEKTLDTLKSRYGNNAVRRGLTIGDNLMSTMDIKKDNVIHPIGYFQESR